MFPFDLIIPYLSDMLRKREVFAAFLNIFPCWWSVYICSYIPAILVTVPLPKKRDYILIGENKSWWWHIFRTECEKTLFWLSLLKWGHEFRLKSVIYSRVIFLSGHLSRFTRDDSLFRVETESLLPLMTFEWLLHRGAKFETLSPPQPVEREFSVDFRFSNPTQGIHCPGQNHFLFSQKNSELGGGVNTMKEGKEKVSNFWLIWLLWKS